MNQITLKSLFLQLSILLLLNICTLKPFAAEKLQYVPIEPYIVTNFQQKSSRKPEFVQLKAQLTVRGKIAAEMVNKHMPLVRDFIITFLSFTDEAVIKDVTQRNRLRAALTKGIQDMLAEKVGNPLIEEFIITQFMWG